MPTKSLKPKNPPITPPHSTHLATVELKQSILNSLSKLSDRDTHQIAVENLETIIKTLSLDTLQMTINTLITTATTTTSIPIKKESIRLLSFICTTHTEPVNTHLIKIVTHIVKSLKDSDSGVKDSCCEAIGQLSFLYLKNGNGKDGCVAVSWFLKPLFEAMNEQNKWVQSGAAMCLVKMVEMACDPPVLSFQKMCSKVCKFLNSPNFLANAALLPIVSSLAQVWFNVI